jgi:hypothetical protein
LRYWLRIARATAFRKNRREKYPSCTLTANQAPGKLSINLVLRVLYWLGSSKCLLRWLGPHSRAGWDEACAVYVEEEARTVDFDKHNSPQN